MYQFKIVSSINLFVFSNILIKMGISDNTTVSNSNPGFYRKVLPETLNTSPFSCFTSIARNKVK